jgi:hypothetical protein
MSNFGMSAQRVYANDSLAGNPAFWSLLGGLDGAIEGKLAHDSTVTTAIQVKLNSPDDADARLNVINVISRATASCIGQKLTGQALNPDDDAVSILHALDPGTDDALNAIINDPSNTELHHAFASKSVSGIIHVITRQTGRGLFQAAEAKVAAVATNPAAVLDEIKKLIP